MRPSRFLVLEGSGHMIHEERTSEVNEALETHFQTAEEYWGTKEAEKVSTGQVSYKQYVTRLTGSHTSKL